MALVIFILSLLFQLVMPNTKFAYFCVDKGNYSQNSAFQNNLNLILPDLSSNAAHTSFHNTSLFQSADTVHALFLCRGDVTHQVCQNCIATAIPDILQKCSSEKEAIIWYDQRMLRYPNRTIFALEEEYPRGYRNSTNKVSNSSYFNLIFSTHG